MKTTRYNASKSANNNVNKEDPKVKGFKNREHGLANGMYYRFEFNLAGAIANAKSGTKTVTYMTNGRIMHNTRDNSLFASFRAISNNGDTVNMTALNVTNRGVDARDIDVAAFIDTLFNGADVQFKFDINAIAGEDIDADDFIDALNDYDGDRPRRITVTVNANTFGRLSPKLIENKGNKSLEVKLDSDSIYIEAHKTRAEFGYLLGDRATEALASGSIFTNNSNEDKINDLIGKANPRSARKKAAGKAKAAAEKVVTPVTTQAANAGAPAQPQVDVATLQAQIAALAAQLAAAQAVAAPTVTTEVAPVTEVETVVEPIIEEVIETPAAETVDETVEEDIYDDVDPEEEGEDIDPAELFAAFLGNDDDEDDTNDNSDDVIVQGADQDSIGIW